MLLVNKSTIFELVNSYKMSSLIVNTCLGIIRNAYLDISEQQGHDNWGILLPLMKDDGPPNAILFVEHGVSSASVPIRCTEGLCSAHGRTTSGAYEKRKNEEAKHI